MIPIESQNFGIEIEMTGLTRAAAARIIAGYFGTQATHVGGGHDTYTVRDNQNRQWKLVSDASIRCRNGNNRSASRDYSVEFVSPICQYEDIRDHTGACAQAPCRRRRVNSSCGIHVHVDASSHTPQTLRNIVNIMASKEDLIYKTLQVQVSREHYCQKADTRFLEELNHKRPKTMNEVEQMWYNGYGGRYIHYDDSRYHGLNLHSVFSKGTIEFRMFNSTLHAGEVKSYIQLCLAISHQALVQRARPASKPNRKMKNIPSALGCCVWDSSVMNSKTARQHLLKSLRVTLRGAIRRRPKRRKQGLPPNGRQNWKWKNSKRQKNRLPNPDEQEQDAPAFSMQM
ncbi:MAG: amidoligase family protein [Clostridia bacterium]